MCQKEGGLGLKRRTCRPKGGLMVTLFSIINYIRGCENQTDLKFHRCVLYLKYNLEKIGRFKNSTRNGKQGAQKIILGCRIQILL